MTYEVQFSSAAARYFKKIKDAHLTAAFKAALVTLAQNPYVGNPKSGDLSGVYGYDVRHKNVHYEIAYKVYESESRMIVVILAGTRENFYDELKRYLRHM